MGVVSGWAGVAADQFATVFAVATELLVLVVVLLFRALALAVRAGPAAFWGVFQLRFQTDQMVGSRACVAEDYFAALLAYLAIILMLPGKKWFFSTDWFVFIKRK